MNSYYFPLTEDQEAIVSLVREAAQKELAPRVADIDATGTFPMDLFQKMKEIGLYGLNIPEKYGGMGLDNTTLALVVEEMAKVEAGFAYSFFTPSNDFHLLQMACGDDDNTLQRMADEILAGKIFAFALTEPDAGSDAATIRTTAVRENGEYVINGTKCFITNGSLADYFIIAATLDRSKGSKGISLFLVERERGVQVGKVEHKMGMRGSNTTEIILDNIRIPADHLLGKEYEGFKYCMKHMEVVRACDMAYCVGIAQAALDYAVKYAKERKTMGKPIIQHQGIGFKLADMQAKVHAARCMVMQCCQAMDNGIPVGTLGPCVKIYAAEAAVEVANDAIQVLGGYGYMADYPVEKLLRDARLFPIFEGTNEIARVVAAGMLMR